MFEYDYDYDDDFNFWHRMGISRRTGLTIFWTILIIVFILADNKIVYLLACTIVGLTWLCWRGFKKLVTSFVAAREAYTAANNFNAKQQPTVEHGFEEEVEFIDHEREFLADYEKEKFAEIVKTFYEK